MANGKIAFLLASGFEDSEFQIPYERLSEAGYDCVVIGRDEGDTVTGYKRGTQVKVDKSIDDVDADDYVALVIPGGHSPDALRADERFVQFVSDFSMTGRPLAAVCHGPQLLMAANLVKGHTLTAWPTVQADLRLIDGVNVKDEPVVVDGNFITSRKPADLEVFARTTLDQIHEWERHHGIGPEAAVEPEGEEAPRAGAEEYERGEGYERGDEESEAGIYDRGESVESHEPYIEH